MSELDNLTGIAATADAGIPQNTPPAADGQAPAGQPPALDYTAEARQGVDFFAAMVVGYAPKAEAVWSEAAKARTAAALAPVMEKYKFTMSTLPPEVGLLIVAGPLLWQSSRLVAAQMAEDKAAKRAQAPDPAPPAAKPGGQEEGPGPTVHPQMALYKQ